MKPRIKKQWVKALRSGDYAQQTGGLCDVRDGVASYCCLGVLVEEVLGEDVWEDEEGPLGYISSGGRCGGVPDDDLLQRVGVGAASPHIPRLLTMNDSDGCTFEEIADYIEENL